MYSFFKLPSVLENTNLNPRQVVNFLLKNSSTLLNSPLAQQLLPFVLLGAFQCVANATGQIDILNTPCGNFTAVPISDDPNLVLDFRNMTMSLLCQLTKNGTISAEFGNTTITPMF